MASNILPTYSRIRCNNRQTILKQQQQQTHEATTDTTNSSSAQHITLATKVRRKVFYNYKQLSTIPLAQLLWLFCCLCLSLAHNCMADCPSLCECKWKSGKESVLCLNANLTHIPILLDAGTQVLDLTGNEISTIPHDTFAAVNLLNLQKVYLARCRLRLIERFAFRKLINLVELDLSHNQLTSIPVAAFEFIPELREIKLSGNPIMRVPNDAFIHVPQLVRLELTGCRLAVVEVRAFAGLETSLEWLKLDGNQLTEVRAGTITTLTNLHGIELAHNQWNCSCALRPLRAWMLRLNIPYGIPPVCHTPPRLAERSWDKIELDDFACVPQIIATDATAHGVEGRNITMSCYVEGVPEPAVRWMVKNRVIANLTAPAAGEPAVSPRTAAASQGRKTYVVNMLRNASNLTILTADMQDAGIYTCAAENKAGKVEASVTLAVSKRPPEPPLSVKIVLLCVLFALLFVLVSSFTAICFCTIRRRRKMRLWNSVPQARSESYEKIEMTTRACVSGANGGAGVLKPDLGVALPNDENGYIRAAMTTPLDCGSDDGNGVGDATINPSSGASVGNGIKRNGEYRNIPTYSDDDGDENNHITSGANSLAGSTLRKASASSRTSPPSSTNSNKRQRCVNNATTTATTTITAITTSEEENDLHIPRLIDLSSNPESASSSISSQVDAAARLGGYAHMMHWTTTPIATTKITSPHSLPLQPELEAKSSANPSSAYYNGDLCSAISEQDIFDSNYPDLLDIAKYAVAQAANSTKYKNMNNTKSAGNTTSNGGLCTLPRKLKNTGKYFNNSSDSQSPLLADNSSKYGSSQLGDASFLNDLTLGRRFSAESSYASYTCSTSYTTGQRSNSFLNLVQSCNKGGLGLSGQVAAQLCNAVPVASGCTRRNPSLPSSPVRAYEPPLKSTQTNQQHQRSFSSAATPLLDFTTLTSRSAGNTGMGISSTSGMNAFLKNTTTTTTTPSSVAAYDYHAAQLERFLEEYRNLQDQLCKMKETCETIRKKEVPLRVGAAHAVQLADPVMFNAAMMAASSPTPVTKNTMLKNKAILPGQPPDPPPYWLHRNAMLKRLNESQSDIFKS